MIEIRMRWYGHVMKMEEANPLKKVMNMEIEGTRLRGSPGSDEKTTIGRKEGHGRLPSESKEIQKTDICGGGRRRQKTMQLRLAGNQASGREREQLNDRG